MNRPGIISMLRDRVLSKQAHTPEAAPIDGAAWYVEHERLSYVLIATMAQANVGPITALGKHNRQVTAAQATLLAHARLISGAQEPTLMAKDDVHTIPYQKLADARAQVHVLEAEVARLRSLLPVGTHAI